MSTLRPETSLPDIRLHGYLGERLAAMIKNHVVGTDVGYITAPFAEKTEKHGWWQTEFWGKWMHSAVPYALYTDDPKLKASIDLGLEAILKSQEPGGYIGNYPDDLRCHENWDVWGMKYTMLGLLHAYDATGRADVLDACRRVCDYLIGEIGPNGARGWELWTTGAWSGYASSSALEPVVWLYRRTGEKKYLDFAAYIVRGMTEPENGPRLLDLAQKDVLPADRNLGKLNYDNKDWNYVCKHNRWKAYEMMSCYQGLLDYAEETGRADLREAAIRTARAIAADEVNLAGGCSSGEAWYHGARHQAEPFFRMQETCVITTWMRLCEKLLKTTDDPFWADELDRTFSNVYLAAMRLDGAEFAGYTPLTGNRYHGQHHCFMHTDCCTANGPRGFLCFLRSLFRPDAEGATFDFYTSATVKCTTARGVPLSFDMYSLYPRDGFVRVTSHTQSETPVRLRFRIPAWCAKATVAVNGEPVADAASSSGAAHYVAVTRAWTFGDVVEIRFEMPVVAHTLRHNVAFTRGPVLLARDSRFHDGDLAEPVRHNAIHDGEIIASFTPVRTPDDTIHMAFSATLPIGIQDQNPEGALPTTVFFCDYASAGNTWLRDNYYRTWIPETQTPPCDD